MINVFLFGVNMLLVYAAWSYVLRRSIIDYFKDRLAEISDDITGYHVGRGLPLAAASHQDAKALVDNYLVFVETTPTLKIALFFSRLRRNPPLRDWIAKRVDRGFDAADAELLEFLSRSREKSAKMAAYCLVLSSPPMLAVVAVVFVLLLAAQALDFLRRRAMRGVDVLFEGGAAALEAYSAAQPGKGPASPR